MPSGEPNTTESAISTSEAKSEGAAVFPVYVSGRVATPGVIELAEGAIVADAVAAAGGAFEGALLDEVNLARPVVEGDHLHIPGPGESMTAIGGGEAEMA